MRVQGDTQRASALKRGVLHLGRKNCCSVQSIDKHADLERLKIDFSYHTYEPERSGGWTSGVPNPHPDGVWFYIDLHDKDSTVQIHTQPISGTSLTFGNKNICFLILEGSETDSISGEMILIFVRNGAKLRTRRSN
jgi:hypothetical protein